jgi:hypothetical protein
LAITKSELAIIMAKIERSSGFLCIGSAPSCAISRPDADNKCTVPDFQTGLARIEQAERRLCASASHPLEMS